MKAIDFLRLLFKHRVLLILTPLIMASAVVGLTLHPSYTYTSETTLYTGIASGEGVNMGINLNYFATNTSFDNLINVTKSRETKQEVAIRLLAQHLMLDKPDPKYMSVKSFIELRRITPPYIRDMVVKSDSIVTDTVTTPLFPSSINRNDYEQTVLNLKVCMEANDTNFVYKLLNYNHPNYSIDAISSIDVTRMESSDLVRLRYESGDPGICQQTLALFMEVCIRNYKKIKVSSSDAVIKYFERELAKVELKLKESEDALLKFNKDNNIINYYEQSKAVAIEKENLEATQNSMRVKLAGTEASIKRIEDKLKKQNKVIPKSNEIVQQRNKLADLNAKIITAETKSTDIKVSNQELVRLKMQAEKLKDDLRANIGELFSLNTTTEGLPTQKLLNEWIDNVIVYEETKAGMQVQDNYRREFQKQYALYAPAGAQMRRIEREINVNENEYIEILRGLGTAKLKAQDAEFTTGVKAVDLPYYPITANPTKRKLMVLVAAFLGFLFVLTLILAMEYFDNTLKNPLRAERRMKLPILGVFPKIFLKTKLLNFPFIINRTLELALQNLGMYTDFGTESSKPKVVLIISTMHQEGKSVVAGNLAKNMDYQGKKVLFLSYRNEEFHEKSLFPPNKGKKKKNRRYPLMGKLLGYEDKRVNYNSPFLQAPEPNLDHTSVGSFSLQHSCCSASTYLDLLENDNQHTEAPDVVLIEIPPLLYYPLPINLIHSADKLVLVTRANRIWTLADERIVNDLREATGKVPTCLLNGVEIDVLESMLGELPKRNGRLHVLLRKLVRFQLFSKQEI